MHCVIIDEKMSIIFILIIQLYENDLYNGAVPEVLGEECGVDGGRHENDPHVGVRVSHVSQQDQREIRVSVSLVHLQRIMSFMGKIFIVLKLRERLRQKILYSKTKNLNFLWSWVGWQI